MERKRLNNRIFISQPMRGLTEKEIREARYEVIQMLEAKGYEVVDSVISSDELDKNTQKHKDVFFLGKSIEFLSRCDSCYFMKGWEHARGCRIEEQICKLYDIERFYDL